MSKRSLAATGSPTAASMTTISEVKRSNGAASGPPQSRELLLPLPDCVAAGPCRQVTDNRGFHIEALCHGPLLYFPAPNIALWSAKITFPIR